MRAIAVFDTEQVKGTLLFVQGPTNVTVQIHFSELPLGFHGLHIHKGGDLRQGCASLCDHWHVGPEVNHGGPPTFSGQRHTGDLGNVHLSLMNDKVYILEDVSLEMLQGRSVIVHADEDDQGQGSHEDSHKTGHSGNRIACALIGRVCS